MSELKKCPFCGGEAAVCDIKEPSVNGWVGGQRCRCFINWVKNGKSLAIAAWNRRTLPENARAHARETGICPMCEDCPDGCPVETPNDSRNRPENEPLTLDELRQMDGEPVWVEFMDAADGTEIAPLWMLVDVADEMLVTDCEFVSWDDERWLAYRRKPAPEAPEKGE